MYLKTSLGSRAISRQGSATPGEYASERSSCVSVGLVGETRLPPDLLPGEIDGGEVRLAPVPLLAAGRVVDPSNRPIPGARVTVSAPGTMKTSEAVAGEDGTFAVWGFIADAEIRRNNFV